MDAMTISVSVDAAGLEQLSARLGTLAGDALRAALAAGLAEAGQYAAGEIVMRADEAGIKGRTGSLLPSISTWSQRGADGLEVFVGVPDESPAARYAYLLTDATVRIVPQGHPYLTIPIGDNLSGAGVGQQGIGDIPDDQLRFRRDVPVYVDWHGGMVFQGLTAGTISGKHYHPLFALVRSVTIKGRNVFDPAIEASHETMVETVQARVDALLAE